VDVGVDNHVFVWRKVGEEWSPQCVACPPHFKLISVMIWGCITFAGVGNVDFVDRNINAKRCTDILQDNFWPVIAIHTLSLCL